MSKEDAPPAVDSDSQEVVAWQNEGKPPQEGLGVRELKHQLTSSAIDNDAGLSLGVINTEKILSMLKEYNKPHPHDVRDKYARLILGGLVMVASLIISGYMISGDKSKTCDGVKNGVTIVLACIAAAGGFLAGGITKP